MNRFKLPFDQFQRYETVRKIIHSLKDKKEIKVLEVGANAHCNLRVFLPESEIIFSDIEQQNVAEGIQFIQADATKLPFQDSEFDFVVSTDVIEHVPNAVREAFICECVRVSRKAFILCCPIDNGLTPAIELDVNQTFRNLLGLDYVWLKEHLEQGLPTVESINKIASEHNIPFTRLEHGQLQLWESMTKLHFIKEAEPELRKLCSMMDEQYNRHLYLNDTGKSCYRSFWVFGNSSDKLNSSILFSENDTRRKSESIIAKELCGSLENIVHSKLNLEKELEKKNSEKNKLNLEVIELRESLNSVKKSKLTNP